MSKKSKSSSPDKDNIKVSLEKFLSDDVEACISACSSLATFAEKVDDHTRDQLSENSVLERIIDQLQPLVTSLQNLVAEVRSKTEADVLAEETEMEEKAVQEAARRAKLKSSRREATKSEIPSFTPMTPEQKQALIEQRMRGLLVLDEKDEQLRSALAHLLGVFAGNTYWGKRVRNTQAIPLLFHLLDSPSLTVLSSVASALANAAQDVQMRGDIALAGGTSKLLRLASTTHDTILASFSKESVPTEGSESVRESPEISFISSALIAVARTSLDYTARLNVRDMGVASLLRFCRSPPHLKVLQAAAEALCQASHDDGVREQLVDSQGIEVFAELIKSPSGMVCTSSAGIIANLALLERAHQQLPPLVEPLVAMLSLSQPRAQASAAAALANCCANESLRAKILSHIDKVMKALREMLKSSHPYSVLCACGLLVPLLQYDVVLTELQTGNVFSLLPKMLARKTPITPGGKEKDKDALMPPRTQIVICRLIHALYSLNNKTVSQSLCDVDIPGSLCSLLSSEISDTSLIAAVFLAVDACAKHDPSHYAILAANGVNVLCSYISNGATERVVSSCLLALLGLCQRSSVACDEFVKQKKLPLLFKIFMSYSETTPAAHLDIVRISLVLIAVLASDAYVALEVTETHDAVFRRIIDLAKLPTDRLSGFAQTALDAILVHDHSADYWLNGILPATANITDLAPVDDLAKVKIVDTSTGDKPGNTADTHTTQTALTPNSTTLDGRRPFYDGWRGGSVGPMIFKPLAAYRSESASSRHDAYVIVADACRSYDLDLCNLVEKAVQECSKATDERASVGILARIVSDAMGGAISTDDYDTFQYQNHFQELREKSGCPLIPVGAIKLGTGRHRAFLFKVLSDCIGICASLVRGNYSYQPHAWNEVQFLHDKELHVVDLLHQPGMLYQKDTSEAAKYIRLSPVTSPKDQEESE